MCEARLVAVVSMATWVWLLGCDAHPVSRIGNGASGPVVASSSPASASPASAPSIVESAGPTASIYGSTDRGRTWRPSDSGVPSQVTVLDFVVAQDAVFAAAGARGVFVSRDEGKTWSAAGAIGANVEVTAIASTPSVLVVGTRGHGVFVSRDGGTTWVAPKPALIRSNVRRMLASDRQIFAATDQGLFVSDDEGASWRHLAGAGQTNAIVESRGDLFLADIQGILRSSDRGASWTRVYDKGTPHNLGVHGNDVFGMLYGVGVIRSQDAGRSWVSAQDGLPTDLGQYTFQILPAYGALFAAQWHGIYVSEPAGAPWRVVSEGAPSTQAITDLVRVGDTLLAAAVPSLSKPVE